MRSNHLSAVVFVALVALSSFPFFCAAAPAPSGSCVVYDDHGGESYCGGIIDTYFLPDGETQESLIEDPYLFGLPGSDITQFRARTVLGLGHAAYDRLPACLGPARSLVCHTYYPPCNASTVAAPRQPCQSLCDSINTACLLLYASFGLEAVDCAGRTFPGANGGYALYPANDTVWDEGAVACNADFPMSLTDIALAGGFQPVCMPPALLPNDNDECVPRCPLNIFTHASWYRTKEAQRVFLFMSLVGTMVTMGTWLIHPDKMRFPSNIVFFLALGSTLVSLGLLMGSMSKAGTHCEDDRHRVRATSDAYCFFQYTFIQFGIIYASCVWLCTIINLVGMVILEKRDMHKFMPHYHTFSLAFSGLLWLIPLAMDKAVWLDEYEMCWVDSDPALYFDLVFFIWIAIFMAVGMVCMAGVVHKIYKVTSMSASLQHQGSSSSLSTVSSGGSGGGDGKGKGKGKSATLTMLRRRVIAQLRSVAFVFVYCFILTWVLAVHWDTNAVRDKVELEVLTMAVCFSEMLDDDAAASQCKLDPPLSPTGAEGQAILAAIQGMAIFAIFMCNPDVINYWRFRLGLINTFQGQTSSTKLKNTGSIDGGSIDGGSIDGGNNTGSDIEMARKDDAPQL